MTDKRTEKDSLGTMEVPAGALWGAQTQRAIENFPVSGQPMPPAFIRALAHVKKTAALANQSLKILDLERTNAIVEACEQIIRGNHADQFPVDRYQTGSGTSTNMNMNEVLARLASTDRLTVHPNDHVNMSQSSNDVIPTTIHVSCVLDTAGRLLPALEQLEKRLRKLSEQYAEQVKTGRTHLMDAMPVTLGQEFQTWADQLYAASKRIEVAMGGLLELPQGGTAVGTGVNADERFAPEFCKLLAADLRMAFFPLNNKAVAQSGIDAPVALSGQLRGLAILLMKIANDLRWMNSGPIHGLSELSLPALQPGSSIMPGKVNPVIPESVAMVSAQVMGLDASIGIAGQSGNFQLNVMLPLVGANLLEMLELLTNSAIILKDKALHDIQVNADRLNEGVSKNPVLVTALNPELGYSKASEIAKEAYRSGRPVIDVAEEMSDLSREKLEELLDPLKLTRGGL